MFKKEVKVALLSRFCCLSFDFCVEFVVVEVKFGSKVAFFFVFHQKVVKGESFMRFSWKRKCFSSFKCWSCMIFVWGLGFWSKSCSFMEF